MLIYEKRRYERGKIYHGGTENTENHGEKLTNKNGGAENHGEKAFGFLESSFRAVCHPVPIAIGIARPRVALALAVAQGSYSVCEI